MVKLGQMVCKILCKEDHFVIMEVVKIVSVQAGVLNLATVVDELDESLFRVALPNLAKGIQDFVDVL